MLFRHMSFPWNVVYSSGDRLCHQRADRSLFLNGNEMPFCSRCTAIWFGLAIGLGFMVLYTIELNEKFLIAHYRSTNPDRYRWDRAALWVLGKYKSHSDSHWSSRRNHLWYRDRNYFG